MRVGIVTTWFERGAAYVSRAYREILERSGAEVSIYGRGGEHYGIGDSDWDDEAVTWAPQLGGRDGVAIVDYGHFARWIERERLDVVLFNEERDLRLVETARSAGLLTVAYVDYYTKKSVESFAIYDVLLCNTRRHHEVFGWHPRCWFVPWGADVDLYRPRGAVDRAPGPLRLFHSAGMGGTGLRKGTDLLLEALARVTGPVELIIHSQRPAEFLGAHARRIEEDPRIRYRHETVPRPGLYHLGDVYVYPTRLEGLGLTVCEALACGLPVITTDAAPMNEFVEHGVTGRLVRVASEAPRSDGYYWPESIVDIDDLTSWMQAYVDDPTLAARDGAAARAYVEKERDWRQNAADLADRLAAESDRLDRPRSSPAALRRLAWGVRFGLLRLVLAARRRLSPAKRRVLG